MSYASTELHPHASKDKHDVIDWEHLPVGECDMNYRLDKNGLSDSSEMQTGLFFGPLFALLLYGCISAIGREYTLHLVGSPGRVFFLAILLGVTLLVRERTSAGLYRGITIVLSVFIGGSVLLIAGGSLNLPERLVALLVATLVGLTWIADSIATTNAWWCTANPRVERATMIAYRQMWHQRWLVDPPQFEKQPPEGSRLAIARSRIVGQVARYRLGVLWLGGALFTGALIGLITARLIGTPLIAVSVIVQTTVILLFVASARMVNASSVSLRSLRLAVNRHTNQGDMSSQPPWVLQLSRGPAWSRELQIVLIVGVIAFLLVATVANEVLPSAHGLLLPLLLVSLSALVAPIWAICGFVIVAGPTIIAHYETLEISGAVEQVARTDWDGYVARLRQSRNPLERCSVWTGCSLTEGYPILIDRKLYFEHVHVVGSTGMGKTALSLTSDLIQLIRNNKGPDAAGGMVIIDCKGDPALLHTAREEAVAAGRIFKWFTNQPNRETYVFNPLLNLSAAGLSLPETVGVIAQSLNLYHGEGYGRGFFGAATRALLQAAYRTSFTFGGFGADRPPIGSFNDLEEALGDCCKDPQEYQAARQLLYVVASMTDFPQLNLTPGRLDRSNALEHAIHLPSLIQNREVAYFYLAGAMDQSSVGHLARLVLYSTMAAAKDFRSRARKPAGVHVFADEAQCLISKNLAPILEQARSYGVGCILAHQNMSQLNQEGGADLRELVQANTAVKRYHSARDVESQKYIAAVSGRSSYYELGWDQLKRRAIGQRIVDSSYACTAPDGVMRVGVQQTIGDRVEIEEIADMNRRLNQSFMLVERSEGLTQLNGGFIMHSDWPVDQQTFSRRDAAPWPSKPSETLSGEEVSPHLLPEVNPTVDLAPDASELDQRMQQVQRQLLGKVDSDMDDSNEPETDPKQHS